MSSDNTLTVSQWSKMMLCLIIVMVICHYWSYNAEIEKHISTSKTVCGKVTKFHVFNAQDNKGAREKVFYIASAQQEQFVFLMQADLYKKLYSPYWDSNDHLFKKLRIGDNVCVEYSLSHHEFSRPKYPYLIKITSK